MVAKKIARARERNWNERSARIHCGFESAKLERANARFLNERTFRKNKNGIACAKYPLDILRGPAARSQE